MKKVTIVSLHLERGNNNLTIDVLGGLRPKMKR